MFPIIELWGEMCDSVHKLMKIIGSLESQQNTDKRWSFLQIYCNSYFTPQERKTLLAKHTENTQSNS